MAVDKFVTKDYLLDQFEGYDREIASNKYASASDIPNSLDDLSDDANHRTVTDTEKTIWNGKADVSAIPTKTTDLTNDSGFITDTVNNLVNYYTKSQTYTQSEVDTLIANAKNGRFIVVATLPTTDIDIKAIYLVPSADPKAGNIKDEYINTDGTSAGWELIGSTAIDLSDYVQKSQTAGLLKNDGTVDITTTGAVSANTSAIDAIKDGSSIDSFGDVEDALADKVNKSTSGGVLGSDGNKINLEENISLFISSQTGNINLRTDTTERISEGSIGIPTSRAVATALKDKLSWSAQAILGAKNLLPYPFEDTTKTASGITFTDNGNGSITIGGSTSQTATANARFFLFKFKDATTIEAGTYKFTKGFTKAGVQIIIDAFNASGAFIKNIVTSENEDIEGTIDYNGYTQVSASIVVKNTTVIDSPITAFPMYRLATDPDPTYVPHVMTNKELTDIASPVGICNSISDMTSALKYAYQGKTIFGSSTLAGIITNNSISLSCKLTVFWDGSNTYDWYGMFGDTKFAFGRIKNGAYQSHKEVATVS